MCTIQRNFLKILFIFNVLVSYQATAIDADDFNGLEGYTIAAVTQVDGNFEGCEYGKEIKLMNGWKLICSTYNYHYAYSPPIAVLIRDIGSGYIVKAVIDDDLYDMQPILKK